MRAMIAANDDRPSFVARHLDEQQGWADDKAANDRDQDRASGARPHDNHQIEEQSEKRDKYIHRLQPRFPSAIQPVRLSRGEVARIPELMRILDRRTAKK